MRWFSKSKNVELNKTEAELFLLKFLKFREEFEQSGLLKKLTGRAYSEGKEAEAEYDKNMNALYAPIKISDGEWVKAENELRKTDKKATISDKGSVVFTMADEEIIKGLARKLRDKNVENVKNAINHKAPWLRKEDDKELEMILELNEEYRTETRNHITFERSVSVKPLYSALEYLHDKMGIIEQEENRKLPEKEHVEALLLTLEGKEDYHGSINLTLILSNILYDTKYLDSYLTEVPPEQLKDTAFAKQPEEEAISKEKKVNVKIKIGRYFANRAEISRERDQRKSLEEAIREYKSVNEWGVITITKVNPGQKGRINYELNGKKSWVQRNTLNKPIYDLEQRKLREEEFKREEKKLGRKRILFYAVGPVLERLNRI